MKRSPLTIAGLGCASLIALFLLCIAAGVAISVVSDLTTSSAQQFIVDLTNPTQTDIPIPPTDLPDPTETPVVAGQLPAIPTLSNDAKGRAIAGYWKEFPDLACIPIDSGNYEEGSIERIIDGDTFVYSIDGSYMEFEDDPMKVRERRLRLIGVDAPENGSPYNEEAIQFVFDILNLANDNIMLIQDVSDTDQYGRHLRYVIAIDEHLERPTIFVNYELVAKGFARATDYPPDSACSDVFLEAENQARAAGLGIWAAGGVSAPTGGQSFNQHH